MRLPKPKSTNQIFIVFLLIIVTFQITVAIYSVAMINQTYRDSQDMNVVGTLRWLTQRLGRSSMQIMAGSSAAEVKSQIDTDITRANTILYALEHGDKTLDIKPATKQEYLEILATINISWAEYKDLVTSIKKGEINYSSPEIQRQTMTSLTTLSDAIVSDIDTYIYLTQEDLRTAIKDIALNAFVLAIISSLIIFFFWYRLLKNGILNPLNSLESAMYNLSDGNTLLKIPVQGSPEIQRTIMSYNSLSDSLHELVKSLTHELNSIVTFNSELIQLSYELLEITTKATEDNLISPLQDKNSDTTISLVKKISNACEEISIELESISKETQLSNLHPVAAKTREQVESFKSQLTRLTQTQSSTISLLDNINKRTTYLLQTSLATAAYADNIRYRLEHWEKNMSLQEVLKLRQMDQEMWKQRVHLYLLGYGTINLDEILNETVCRLGHWIYNHGQGYFNNHPRFRSLMEHHTKYHETAIRILDMGITHREISEELAILEHFSQLISIDLQELEKIATSDEY